MLAVDLFHHNHLLLGYLKDRLVGNSRGKDVSYVPTSKLIIASVGVAQYVRVGTTHYSGFILEVFSEIKTLVRTPTM